MLIKRAHVLLEQGFVEADIRFENEILELGDIPGNGIDARGLYLTPGLVDIHTHGAAGADFSDATQEALRTMADFYAQNGITSFFPTTMARPEAELLQMIQTLQNFDSTGTAQPLGLHLEGPFINPEACGAHDARYVKGADTALLLRLLDALVGMPAIVDVAPELPNAEAFIRAAASRCTVSLGHTRATYAQSMAGFSYGATHVTHLYNVMPPLLHRAPGLIGAAYDRRAFAELIVDGIHIHESAVRAAFSLFGPERICLISDSMRAAGLLDGSYTLGGQDVTVSNGKATLLDGTIAGSCISLLEGVRNAIRFGIAPADAFFAATRTPMAALNNPCKRGQIQTGFAADLLLLDADFQLQQVFIGGKSV